MGCQFDPVVFAQKPVSIELPAASDPPVTVRSDPAPLKVAFQDEVIVD